MKARAERVLVCVAMTACTTLSGLSGGPEDAGVETGGSDVRVPDAPSASDAGDASPPEDAAPDAADADARCPRGVGPAMVETASLEGVRFCIDATEVTAAEYQQFLLATAGNTAGQPAECAWNDSYAPTCAFDPVGQAALPVGCIDWCDARAFCAWNNKRLCGRVGGGALQPGDVISAARSQWYSVCSANGARIYPYGNAFEAGACNTAATDAGAPWPAGSRASCVGGFAGVFDMSGNVVEWEDLCTADDGGDSVARCAIRGGAYDDDPTTELVRCDNGGSGAYEYATRSSRLPFLGFRCCAD